MVRQSVSRRAVVAAAAGLPAALAGCLDDGSCRTVVDGIETVGRNGIRVYDVEAKAGQRLYVGLRRHEGPRASLAVFDPDEEPLIELAEVDRTERRFEINRSGVYSVVTQNNSTTDAGQWATTIVVYRGWCADVF